MRDRVLVYLVAIAVTIAALLVRALLTPLIQDRTPFITLYAAVALVVGIGGLRPC